MHSVPISTRLLRGNIPAGLAGVTFAFSSITLDPFHALRWALLSFAAIAVLCSLGFRKDRNKEASPDNPPEYGSFRIPIALVAGYALASAASWFPAVNKAEAFWQIAQVSAWCVWFLSILSAVARDPSLWRPIRRAAVFCALLGAGIAVSQYWGAWNPLHNLGREPVGLQGNRNLLASLLFLLAPWTAWALLEEKGSHRILAACAWMGFCYALAITQCRAVWLGSFVAAAAAAVLARLPRSPAQGAADPLNASPSMRARRRVPLIAFMALSLCGAFLFHELAKPASDPRGGGLARAASILDPAFDSNAQRLALWGKTLTMIRRHPLAGAGAGNWKIVLPSLGMSGLLWPDMAVTEVRPYNDWLWTFSEIGIPGGLCWLGLWLAGLLAGLRVLRDPARKALALPALLLTAGLAGFGVVSALDFPKERPEHMAWYAMALAALMAFGVRPRTPALQTMPTANPRWPAKWALGLGLVAAAASSAAFSCVRWHDETLVRKAMAAHANQDWSEVISVVARLDGGTCTLNPAASPMAWHEGIARYQSGDRAGAERAFSRALELHPYHIHSLYDLAVCKLGDGDSAAALVYLARSLDISPGFPEAALAAAHLSLLRGSYASARTALDGVDANRRGPEWHSLDGLIALHERNFP